MDDRAVSVAVTHVLTIGITTVLISGLLLGAGNLLDQQSDRAGERELRAIGDRIATELVTASEQGKRANATVAIRTTHPSRVVGDDYVVELDDSSDCFASNGYDGCLTLSSSGSDLTVEVPVSTPAGVAVDPATVSGDSIVVVYDPASDEVTIEEVS